MRRILLASVAWAFCSGSLLAIALGSFQAVQDPPIFAEAPAQAHDEFAVPAEDTPEVLRLMAQHEAELAKRVDERVAIGRAAQLRYQGTRAAANPNAGAQADLQKRIADTFAGTDPVPDDRVKYFDWCLTHDFVVHIGWNVSVKSVTGPLVVVEVSPWFMGTRTATAHVFDYCLETWVVSGDTLEFVKLEPGVDTKRGIISGD